MSRQSSITIPHRNVWGQKPRNLNPPKFCALTVCYYYTTELRVYVQTKQKKLHSCDVFHVLCSCYVEMQITVPQMPVTHHSDWKTFQSVSRRVHYAVPVGHLQREIQIVSVTISDHSFRATFSQSLKEANPYVRCIKHIDGLSGISRLHKQ